jgi:hypothetical protein
VNWILAYSIHERWGAGSLTQRDRLSRPLGQSGRGHPGFSDRQDIGDHFELIFATEKALSFQCIVFPADFCISKGVRGERCIVAPALRTQTRKFQLGKTCAMPRSSRSQERKLGACFDAMADG